MSDDADGIVGQRLLKTSVTRRGRLRQRRMWPQFYPDYRATVLSC